MTLTGLLFLGVFWVLELISTAIQAEYDRNEHCVLLLVLDLPNLLTVSLGS